MIPTIVVLLELSALQATTVSALLTALVVNAVSHAMVSPRSLHGKETPTALEARLKEGRCSTKEHFVSFKVALELISIQPALLYGDRKSVV